MNTFEQLIGKLIIKVLRLKANQEYGGNSLIALFLQFDSDTGLLIGQDFEQETITLDVTTLLDVRNDYGTEYLETCLDELEPSDLLNQFSGETIKSIKVGEFLHPKFSGGNFVIKKGYYAGIILYTKNNKLTVFSRDTGLQVVIDADVSFPDPDSWILK